MSARKVTLDARDRALLQGLADGRPIPEVAAELGLKPSYLKHVIKRVCDLLGADNRTHAVAQALRRGYIV